MRLSERQRETERQREIEGDREREFKLKIKTHLVSSVDRTF